jgi:hypothetical protein
MWMKELKDIVLKKGANGQEYPLETLWLTAVGAGGNPKPSHTPLLSPHMLKMESNQKSLDEMRTIWGAMECNESPLSESKKAHVLEFATIINVNGEEKLSKILTADKDNPILVMKVMLERL